MKSFSNLALTVRGLVVLVLLTGVSCAPNPLDGLSNEDAQVFITNRDQTARFSDYATFSISDSVRVADNDRVGVDNSNFSLAFTGRIAQRLAERGYSRVGRTQQPDLGVNVTFVRQTQMGVTTNPFWWNDPAFWGPGVGPGWGWGGGGGFFYPSYYQFYQVSESYWVIELLDLKNQSTNNRINVIWNAQIRGGAIDQNPNRLVDAIFAQSEYLRRSN